MAAGIQARTAPEYFEPIDGLRMIAVLSVILFHLGGIAPAGFVGVDVFFVISGFVVSAAAQNIRAAGLLDFLLQFYARRVIRIVPALSAVLMASFALSVLLLPVMPTGRFSDPNVAAGFAAFFGFSNLVLAHAAGDYWSPSAEFNPFTHTWSLAVEEQFYLLGPFLLYLWKVGRKGVANFALLGLMILSIATMGGLQAIGRGADAFYMTPSRFWELATGCFLFFSLGHWRAFFVRLRRTYAEVLSVGSILALLGTTLWTPASGFPWPFALYPVLAAGLAIVCATALPDTVAMRSMASPASRWLGARSYALYLWHWPIIVFARWTIGVETPTSKVFILILTLAFAESSYYLVERPSRRALAPLVGRRWVVPAGAVLSLVIFLTISMAAVFERDKLTLSQTGRIKDWSQFAELDVPAASCQANRSLTALSHGGSLLSYSPSNCSPKGVTVFVLGDSHAGAYAAMLIAQVRRHGVNVKILTKPGCSVISFRRKIVDEKSDCVAFIRDSLKMIAEIGSADDIAFFPGLRIQRIRDQFAASDTESPPSTLSVDNVVIDEARHALAPILSKGVGIVFEAPKPVFHKPFFRCSDIFNKSNPDCRGDNDVDRAFIEERRNSVLVAMKQLAESASGVEIWDPLPALCGDSTCPGYVNGRPIFFDGDHLSGYGNGLLVESFNKIIESRKRRQ